MLVNFNNFSPAEYAVFLRAKAIPEFQVALDADGLACGLRVPDRFAHMLDAAPAMEERSRIRFSPFLFPDQVAITETALAAERFACWSDCGLGKTLIELEFARHVAARTGGRVLIITLPDIVPQMMDEARKFYRGALPMVRLETRAEMRRFCSGKMPGPAIGVTNYEKMNPDGGPETQIVTEMKGLAGLILDESSRLKTGGGKQKWALIKSARGIRYKLSCTATPAPNEVMEFASQAAFLERIRDESEVIWSYFTRDPDTNEWTVKRHARPHFFRWMASWSIYLRDPAAFGWTRKSPPVPEPEFLEHRIAATSEQISMAFAVAAQENGAGSPGDAKQSDMFAPKSLGMVGRNVLSQIAKGFSYGANKTVQKYVSRKPGYVAQIVSDEVAAGLQTLVWCTFDAEVDIIEAELKARGIKCASLGGKNSRADRAATLEKFRDGRLNVLVSKAAVIGFGLNFQHCGAMVFSGFNDSFESFYQAVRRAYRFGQTRRLRVHLPYIPELEEPILRNVLRKSAQFEQLISEQQEAYVAARAELLKKAA